MENPWTIWYEQELENREDIKKAVRARERMRERMREHLTEVQNQGRGRRAVERAEQELEEARGRVAERRRLLKRRLRISEGMVGRKAQSVKKHVRKGK